MNFYYQQFLTLTQKCGFTVAFFLIALTCLAQAPSGPPNPNAIVPPTPSAMKLTEFHAQHPNLYTGTANVSIPLYTIDFDGWKLPLSLSYNATGVRTNEEAGDVGLGWAPNWTGVISRTIRGSDDFSNPTSGYYVGYVYNNLPIATDIDMGYGYLDPTLTTVPDPAPGNSYYYWLAHTLPDTQPDIFNYNFFGYSGSFVLGQKNDPNNKGLVTVFKLTKDACSITFDETNKIFSVITPEGYKGDFTIKELSTTMTGAGPTWINVSNNTCWGENFYDIQGCKNFGRFETISSWYLYQITSPRGQKITFTYDLTNGRSSYLSNARSFGELDDPHSGNPIVIQTVHEHVYLTNIQSEEVNVNFSMENREDLRLNTFYGPNSSNPQFPQSQLLKRYTGLTVTGIDAASTLNKRITFKQSYFNQQYQDPSSGNQSDTELLWLRSRLDRVSIDDQEYRFYYNNKVPNKLTNGVDHFGFYNGNDQNTNIVSPQVVPSSLTSCNFSPPNYTTIAYYNQYPNRLVNFDFGKCGLLTKVKYPTRGYSVFTYEAHTYFADTAGVVFREQNQGLGGGARIQSIAEYDYDGTLVSTKSYQYNQVPNMVSPVVTSGKLMTPLYNRYVQFGRNTNSSPPMLIVTCWNNFVSGSTIVGNNSAEGKAIGYSKVFEFVKSGSESYMNTYYFENHPNKLSGGAVLLGFPNLNGHVSETRQYNSQGNIVQRTVNEKYNHAIDSVRGIAYAVTPTDNSNSVAYATMQYYTGTFITPFKVTTYLGNSQTGFTDSDVANFNVDVAKQGKASKQVKTFTYNSSYLLASEQDSTSRGDVILNSYKYPIDYASAYASPTIKHMRMPTVNIVAPVIEQFTFKNGQITSAAANKYFYDSLGTKQLNLIANYSYTSSLDPNRTFNGTADGNTFTSPYELNTTFSQYDVQSGKLLEYTGRDGVTNAFIWGYNNKLPIVHGVGTTYSQLSAAYNATTSGSTINETALRSDPNVAGKPITTYQHNPLVGVTKITDPTGTKTSFAYDAYGRLQLSKDNKDQILSQNKYHLMTLPPTRTLSANSSSITFGTFYHCNLPSAQTVTFSNTGEDDLPFTLTVSSGFSVPLLQGTLYAGTSIDVPVSFTGSPSTTPYTGAISISAPTRTDIGGVSTIPLSATYLPVGTSKAIQLNPSSLIFSYAHQTQYVTISNTGNECLTLAGTTSLAANDPDWYASVPATTIAPGQNATMSLFLENSNPTTHSITINADNNLGSNVLSADINRASLGVNSSFTFASFTTVSSTQSFPVTNTGNTNVTVSYITGTSNSHFTNITPQSFILTPGQSQNVSVTYTATDFSSQSITLSIMADTQSSTNVTVTAQRTQVYQLTVSPTSVTIKPSMQTGYSYLTNTGNVPVTINAAPATYPGFLITYNIYSGATWVPVNPNTSPVTLQPGNQMQVQVTTSSSGDFSSASGQITIFDSLNNTYTLYLVRSPTP